MRRISVKNGHPTATIEHLNPQNSVSEEEKLNLNCKAMLLPECRANALRALQKEVMRNYPGRSAGKDYFKRLLEKYTRADSYKAPYVGILIKWLESKI